MKQKTITFKVDEDIEQLLVKIPNKSEFIRNSIIKSLDCICPLCDGSGILNTRQKSHWDQFKMNHSIERCGECDELYISCKKK